MDVDAKRLIRDAVAAMPPPPMSEVGSVTALARILTPDSPITLGQRFWPFNFVSGYGPEADGAACAFTVDSGGGGHAVNLGSKNPSGGAIVLIHNVEGYWFFEYHGRLATE